LYLIVHASDALDSKNKGLLRSWSTFWSTITVLQAALLKVEAAGGSCREAARKLLGSFSEASCWVTSRQEVAFDWSKQFIFATAFSSGQLHPAPSNG
jgi:hypothetical protein